MKRASTTYFILAFVLSNFTSLFAITSNPADTLIGHHFNQRLKNMAAVDNFVVKDLIPGNHYSLLFSLDDDVSCLPTLSMDLPHQKVRETSWQVILEFRATRSIEMIRLKSPCPSIKNSNYFISSRCDSCPLEESAAREGAGINATDGVSAETLVKDVFIGGGCFEVENITFKGPDIARGTFKGGASSINMEEGVILSTGNVKNSHGPNKETNVSTEFKNADGQGDQDLKTLLRRSGSKSTLVTDVAVLEFDFTPTTDKLSFQYAFASDEYCDFVNSDFNDVFGFFISGPGINGPFKDKAINIAIVPGTNDYVAINSINYRENKQYYNNNRPIFQGQNGSGCRLFELLDLPAAKNDIEYDGFTDVLTAETTVIPCETYHIKLVVGDVQDRKYDSAVFLKANSFNLGDPAELATEITDAVFPDSNLVYESCQESFFVFKRTEDSDITRPQKVTFTVSDKSTATPFTDYSPISSPVIIPAGKDSIKVPIFIFRDDLDEGNETIIFELETACTCENIETELIIAEPEDFSIFFDKLSTCEGGEINFSPNIEGGIGDYTYKWSNNETTPSLNEIINESTTYKVTVTDKCGISSESEVIVTIETPKALINGTVIICNGESEGQIEVDFTGSGPYSLEYTLDGETKNISNIESNNFILPFNEAGTYEAISMMANGCDGTGSGNAKYIITDVVINHNFGNPKCFDTKDGFIEIMMDETEANYSYEWGTGANQKKIEKLDEGTYSVIITNELGCSDTKEIQLKSPTEIIATLEAKGLANCYNLKGGSIDLKVGGGSPGYNFDWNNGLSTVQSPTELGGGTYKVDITDANGCKIFASVDVPSDIERPIADAQVNEIISCITDEITLKTVGTSVGDNFSYSWTKNGNIGGMNEEIYTTKNPIVNSAGSYTLVVLDVSNGCEAATEVTVLADVDPPAMNIVPLLEELNCKIETLELTGQITKKMDDFSVNWTSNDGNFLTERDILIPAIDAPGTYKLEITNNQNGCVNEMSIAINQNISIPAVSVDKPLELTCDRNAVSLKTEVDMEDSDYEFTWQTVNGNFSENRNTLNPSVNESGTYILTVKDLQNFCETAIESRVLIDTLSPDVDAGNSFVFTCAQTSVSLSGSGSEGNNFVSEWTTNDGFIIGGAKSLSPLVNVAGAYTLSIKNIETGCASAATVVLQDDANRPNAIISEPDNITCSNPSIQLDASNSTQGGSLTYNWETIDGNIIEGNNSMKAIAGSGGFYTLIVKDLANECEARKSIEVLLDTISPIASIIAPEVLNCGENEVEIDGSSSSSGSHFIYNWHSDDGNFTSNTTILSPTINAAGTYQIGITNTNNGCSIQASLIITEEKPESMNIELGQPLCFGEKGRASVMAVQGGEGPYAYSIDGGNNYYNDPRFGQLTPGFYNVKIKDKNGCTLEEVIQIDQPDELSIDLDGQIEIQLGDSLELQAITNIPANEIAEVVWTPASNLSCDDCLAPIAKPLHSVDYQVDIIDQDGCEASASINFLVDETPHIFVPNIFSPFSSEAGNDHFTIFADEGMVEEIKNFQIYTRWGEVVFQRDNFSPNQPSLGWDGRFDRKVMKPAVFVYRATILLISGRKVEIKGDFALVE